MDPVTPSIVTGLIAASKIFDHFKGRRKDSNLARVERKVDTVLVELQKNDTRITAVEHITIGVGGENGLRARVGCLEEDMDELKRKGVFERGAA